MGVFVMPKYQLLKCSKCQNNIKKYKAVPHSGLCKKCSQHKTPYIYIFNKCKRNAKLKHIDFSLKYKDFLEFTKNKNCTYCSQKIIWNKYGRENTKYNLDRKNNNNGYSKENCVVCCWNCNNLKGNKLSYDNMLLLSNVLNYIRQQKEYFYKRMWEDSNFTNLVNLSGEIK